MSEEVTQEDSGEGLVESGETVAAEAGEGDSPTTPQENEETQETPEDPGAKPKNSAQKRIGELTRKQREAERERDYWREVALGRPAAGPEPNAGMQREVGANEPLVEQFASYEDFVDARADWRAEQRIRAHEQAKTREQTVREVQQKTQAAVAKAAEKFADFEDVALSPDLAMTPVMAEALLDCENFPEVAYHLGQHPEEAKRIAKLSPAAQAREIGKLEVKLASAVKDATEQQTARRTTNAPAPVKPVGAKGAAAKAVDLNDPNLPLEVWEKEHDRLQRERREGARASRRN